MRGPLAESRWQQTLTDSRSQLSVAREQLSSRATGSGRASPTAASEQLSQNNRFRTAADNPFQKAGCGRPVAAGRYRMCHGLLRLPARRSRSPAVGERLPCCPCNIPGTKISTPVSQLDFFYFYCVGTLSARIAAYARSGRSTARCVAISKSKESNLFALIRCTTTYEVYKRQSALYRRYLPEERRGRQD